MVTIFCRYKVAFKTTFNVDVLTRFHNYGDSSETVTYIDDMIWYSSLLGIQFKSFNFFYVPTTLSRDWRRDCSRSIQHLLRPKTSFDVRSHYNKRRIKGFCCFVVVNFEFCVMGRCPCFGSRRRKEKGKQLKDHEEESEIGRNLKSDGTISEKSSGYL